MLYNIDLYSLGSDIMITNKINKVDEETIELPLIIRATEGDWVPDFDIWPTKIDGDTSYINCTQNFGSKLRHYTNTEIDSRIGYFDNDNLVIHWKALVDSETLKMINKIYRGKLRATCWQRRYATYYGTSSDMPWLHSVVLEHDEPGYIKHHINGVSSDNRRQNLHSLLKREHDSIDHPTLYERKQMFADPKGYWRARKSSDVNEFIRELALIIADGGCQNNFIAKFAEENIALAREILEYARYDINLSSVKCRPSKNRTINSHLNTDYLDAYELEKYLKYFKICAQKTKPIEGQLRLL